LKTYALGLLGLALLGAPAWGQTPPPGPHVPVSSAMVPCPCPCPADGTGCNQVCVPEHYVKETKKWCYASRCEPFCICYFHGLHGGCGCEGEDGHCGHLFTRRVLLKKPRVCKEDAIKCVPGPAGCADGPCFGPGQMYFPSGPGPVRAAPAPGPAPGPRPMAAPGPMSYGPPGPMPLGPPEAFGGETAFTPPAPRPGAFGSPATAFSPGR
jgi:hypothetical protein